MIAKACALFGIGLLLVIFQGLVQSFGVPAWLIPQGLVACVMFVAFFECSVAGAFAAFGLGLLLDLTSATLLGPWAGAFVCVYALVAFISQRLFVESALVAMVVSATCTVLAGCIYLVLAFEYQSISLEDLATLLGQAAATAAITPAIVRVLRRAWNRRGVVPLGRGSTVTAV